MLGPLRRALAIALLSLPVSVIAAPCAGFSDVDATDPFCPNVTWIKNRSITLGCAVGLYCPDLAVTRRAIAAFLNRLGDVVLPPNVIWVAPVGGMFQSIQAAIDYAAMLPADPRRLVKVAPGTYKESIVMAPGVDIEGSGIDATVISNLVCGSGPPTTATVQGATGSQLREVTVEMAGAAGSLQCAAVYLDGVHGTALRNVRIDLRVVGGGPAYGVVVASSDPNRPYALVLDQVHIDASDLGAPRTGILINGGQFFSTTLLRDVTVNGHIDVSPVTGVRVNAAVVSLDRTKNLITASPISLGDGIALAVVGISVVSVERSALRAEQQRRFADVAGESTLRIASSLLEGSLTGAATCFGTYSPSFAPVAC